MPRPLAVYVHLPWCVRKCPYCDFNSHAAPAELPEDAYVAALLDDLAGDLDLAAGRKVGSVFFGGGTPSLSAPPPSRASSPASPAALPWAATPRSPSRPTRDGRARALRDYARAGVNRVSLGAQSFSAPRLQALGRIHAPQDTEAAVRDLERAGIDNFNLDLMYALPGQDVEGALADLRTALSLGPAHLSHYQLTLEAGTPFFHRPPPLPDDDVALDMQLACQSELEAAGLRQYEVSAYAARPALPAQPRVLDLRRLPRTRRRAHGKLTAPGASVWRTEKPRMPRDYMARAAGGAAAARRRVVEDELPFEWALNALRLAEGSTLASFEESDGLSARVLEPAITSLQTRGLVDAAGGRLRATPLGFRFLNDVQAAFLPERAA